MIILITLIAKRGGGGGGGGRVSTEVRAFAFCLQPIWPRFDSQTQHHKWAEFVGSLLCSERIFFKI